MDASLTRVAIWIWSVFCAIMGVVAWLISRIPDTQDANRLAFLSAWVLFALAIVPLIARYAFLKKQAAPSSAPAPIALDPALRKAKWRLLERIETHDKMKYYAKLYKQRVLQDNSAITDIDVCRFLRSAIVECRDHCVGPESQLGRLLTEGHLHIQTLSRDQKDLQGRIDSYTQAGESAPANLITAQATLQASLEHLERDYAALNHELARLQAHFDQFTDEIVYLEQTEADLLILHRIEKNLGHAAAYNSDLPELRLQQSWEIGQRFYKLAQQTEHAVDELSLEIALDSASSADMEAMLAHSVAKTSRIESPFPA